MTPDILSFADPVKAADLSSFADPVTAQAPARKDGDTTTGFKRAFMQVPELAYGAGALTAMSAEHLFGGGGLSTAAKDYFIGKYSEKKAGNEKYAPTVEFTDAWSKLKSGDIGSMVDWLQDSAGYIAGQAVQTIATAGVGAIAGKAVVTTAAEKMLSGVVAKQAAKIAEEQAAKKGLGEAAIAGLMPEATKLAAQRVAQNIGAGVALAGQNLGMEAGDIFGGLSEESAKTGKDITGDDLLRAWGSAAAAAGTEVATDLLGIGAMTGRIKIGGKAMQSMTGAGGKVARGVTGAAVGMPIEAGQEYLQTWLEQYGAGTPTDTAEARRERVNAAAVGGLGGGAIGGGAGLLASAQPEAVAPTPAEPVKALTYQGSDAMVVFPDGTTMTAAEAKERGLNKQVTPKTEPAPVDVAYTVMSSKSVDEAIQAASTAISGVPSIPYDEGAAQAGLINADWQGKRTAELREQGIEPAPGSQIPAFEAPVAPAPLKALTDQGSADLVTFKDGTTMTAAEAKQRGLYQQVVPKADLATLSDVTAPASTGELRPPAAVTGATTEIQPTAMELAMRAAQEKKAPGLINSEPLPETAGTRVQPVTVASAADVAHASGHVETEPSDGQKEAGNYAKGHIKLQGLDITIENPEGSVRRGKDAGGKAWEVTMPAHYGYVKRTEGADGDQVDVYIGPEPLAPEVFVVDQIDNKTGKFDEHKAMLGYPSREAAEGAYQRGFSDGKGQDRMGAVTAMQFEEFKTWAQSGDTMKPLAYSGRAVPAVAPATDQPAAQPAAPDNPLRPMVESLIKRRAAARQSGIDRSVNTAIERAKAALAGDGKPGYFSTLAKTIKSKDAATAAILDQIAAHLKNPKPATAAAPAAKPAGFSDAEVARREKLKKQAKAKKQIDTANDSIIKAIAKLGGLSMDHRLDITGNDKGSRQVPFVGHLFSQNGRGLDDMATSLGQYGYLTDEELAGVDGGVPALRDKIREEYDRAKSHYSNVGEEERLANDWDMAGLEQQEQAEIADIADEVVAEIAGSGAIPDSWNTMSEEQKNEELDALFGGTNQQAVAQGGNGAGESRAPETGPPETEAVTPAEPDATPSKEGVSTSTPLELTGETPAELLAKTQQATAQAQLEAAQSLKAAADVMRDSFTLTGSARQADEVAARGQGDLLTAPAPQAKQENERAGLPENTRTLLDSVWDGLANNEIELIEKEVGREQFEFAAISWLEGKRSDVDQWLASVSDHLQKIFRNVVAMLAAVAITINAVNVRDARAVTVPTAATKTISVQRIIEKPKALFNGIEHSAMSELVANWVMTTNANNGKSFIIADKADGKIIAFDASGKAIADAPALYGEVMRDTMTAEQLAKPLSAMGKADKITPAGKWNVTLGESEAYGWALRLEGGNGLAIHSVYLGTPSEKRQSRLNSATASDNFVTWGCINVPAEFSKTVLENNFRGDQHALFILPIQTENTIKTFGIMEQDLMPTVVTESVDVNGGTPYSGNEKGRKAAGRREKKAMLSRNAPDKVMVKTTKNGAQVYGNSAIIIHSPIRSGNGRGVIYSLYDPAVLRATDGDKERGEVGKLDVDVAENGQITGIRGIYVNDKLQAKKRGDTIDGLGYGERAIRAILSSLPDGASLKVSGILPEARGFWEKMGAAIEPGRFFEDGQITRSSYERSRTEIQDGSRDSGLVFSRGSGNADTAADEGGTGGSSGLRQGNRAAVNRAPERGLSVSAVAAEIGLEISKTKAGRIRVIQSWEDLPQAERELIYSQSAFDVQGVFEPDSKAVYLIADNIKKGEAFAVLMHEAGVHLGLEPMIGAQNIAKLAGQIKAWSKYSGDSAHGKLAKLAVSKVPANTPADVRDEEIIAYFVEEAVRGGHGKGRPGDRGPIAQWFRQLWQMVKSALQKLDADPSKLTVEDVVSLARGALERSLAGGDVDATGRTLMSSRTDQTQTEGFKAWFGDSKVVDADGNPLVVYHVTSKEFSEFKGDRPIFVAFDERGARMGASGSGITMPMYAKAESPANTPDTPVHFLDVSATFKSNPDADAVYVEDEAGVSLALRSNTQIKSAVGNRGTFDAKNPNILMSRSGNPDWVSSGPAALKTAAGKIDTFAPEQSIGDKVKALTANWQKRLVQGIFDAYAPLKELSHKAYVLARMTKSADGVLEGMLLYGKPRMDADGAIVGDVDGKGFLGAMKDLKGEHDRFFMWVAGNRAERLMNEGREHLFSADEVKAMKELNRGKMADGGSRESAFMKALTALRDYNKAVMDIAEKTGLIDGAARHLWEHDFYIPFYRVMEDDKISGPGKIKGLVRQQAFRKLKGGQENLGDLMANTLRNWSHLLSASLANQAASNALGAAVKVGAAAEVPAGTKGATFAMIDGKQTHYEINDPFLLDAISAIESASFKGLPMKLMSKFKHYLTLGVTVSPTFRIRNLMRDTISAMGQNDMSFNAMNNLVEGFKGTDKKSANYASMLFGGGMMRFGTYLEGDRAEHVRRLIDDGVDPETILTNPRKVKAALGKLWDGWQDFGDRMENVNRATLYKQYIAQGKSHLEASYAARDMMDFSMQGSWVAMRILSQVVPFLNARAQGLYKLGRSAKQDPKRMGYVTGAVALASIALLLAYDDDEDWKKREDWDRDAYWWFKIGDTAFRIPKPFEIGAMGTLAERGAELMINDEMTGARFGERMRHMLGSTFAFNPTPQMVKPMLDIYSNIDSFTGRQIESMAMDKLSKSERTTANTTMVARALGAAGDYTNLSPVQVDHLIRAYFGWLGTHAAMTVDMMAQPFKEGERPTPRIGDLFVVGDFVKDLPQSQSRYVEQFYKQAKAVSEVMADIKHAREIGELRRAQQILEDNQDKVALSALYAGAQRSLSKINKEIRLVQTRGSMSGDEKRARLDYLMAARNKLAETVNDRAVSARQ